MWILASNQEHDRKQNGQTTAQSYKQIISPWSPSPFDSP